MSQLAKYFAALERDPQAAYAEDNRTQAVADAHTQPGRISRPMRVSIATAAADAAGSMTPEERGHALEAWLKAKKRL